jgi:hypothetical protein
MDETMQHEIAESAQPVATIVAEPRAVAHGRAATR